MHSRISHGLQLKFSAVHWSMFGSLSGGTPIDSWRWSAVSVMHLLDYDWMSKFQFCRFAVVVTSQKNRVTSLRITIFAGYAHHQTTFNPPEIIMFFFGEISGNHCSSMQHPMEIPCTAMKSLPKIPETSWTGWWFGTFFLFPDIGNNHSNWLIFFRGVETTNQWKIDLFHGSGRSSRPSSPPFPTTMGGTGMAEARWRTPLEHGKWWL